MSSRMVSMACAILVLTTLATSGARAGEVNQTDGLALRGYDPVAYFTQHKAVKGDPQWTATHHGVTYEFASQETKPPSRQTLTNMYRNMVASVP